MAPPLRHVLLFALPAATAVAVGLWGFTAVPLSGDEAVTSSAATRSVPDLFRLLGTFDAVHGAYYWLMHYWIVWFGAGEVSLRVPSLIGVAVAAGLLALLGMRLASWPVGLLSGILFACAPVASMFAQDARPYGIVFALVIGLTMCLTPALAGDRIALVGYGLLLLAAAAMQLFALLILPAHAVVVSLAAGRSRTWRPVVWWLVACLAALAPLSALVRLAIAQQRTAAWIRPPGWQTVSHTVVTMAGGTYLVVAAVTLIGFAFGTRSSRGLPVLEVAAPWLILPAVLLLVISQVKPLYAFRYVAFSAPALALLLAAGLVRLRRWLLVTATALLIAATAPAQDAVRHEPTGVSGVNDLRADAAFLSRHERPGDAIIYLAPGQRYMSSAYPLPYRRLTDVAIDRTPTRAANLAGGDAPVSSLPLRLATISRVWTMRYFIWPGGGPGYRRREAAVFKVLHAAGFSWVSTSRFRGSAIALWVRKSAPGPG